ncbi:hypothetical protein LOZ66_001853 [Ophidiomyces ophidiicola]|nr:hypothetical protein LOZ66_001853 [Ophidiomyces ophidiicola]
MEESPVSVPLLIIQSLKETGSGISPLSVLLLIALVCVLTRVVTGAGGRSEATFPDGSISPTRAPYWFPYIGHGVLLGFRRRILFEKLRTGRRNALPALYVQGKDHYVLLTASLANSLLEKASSSSNEGPAHYILENVFGAPRNTRFFKRTDLYSSSGPMQFLNEDPWLTDIASTVSREIKQAMPNLLSFSQSVVDQSTWERLSGVSILDADSGPICETDLFALVRNFIGVISTTAIMGKSFTEAFPYSLNDLWEFDKNFNAMLLGVPRWVPFPGLVTSYAARRRLLLALKAFHNALAATEIGVDPGFDWQDMDDVSEVIKSRSRSMVDAGYTAEQAAAEHLFFLWTLNLTTNTIVFWNLVHILSDKELHGRILEETRLCAQASRPNWQESGFNIPEPPRLSLDPDKIASACPLLKATYMESLRIYSTPISYRRLNSDIILEESNSAATNRDSIAYRCEAGSYVAIPHFIHNTDPEHFPEPRKFDPQRFLAQRLEDGINSQNEVVSVENESLLSSELVSKRIDDIWPDGINDMFSYSRSFAERQALLFTAAFLVMWDIQRADGKAWEVLPSRNGSATCVPKRDIRVNMKLKI